MKNQPAKLSRKAVKRAFTKVSSQRWDYLFRHEAVNGIRELRVEGPFEKAYYGTQGIIEWLVTEAVYTADEFSDAPKPRKVSPWGDLSAKKHCLAA